MTTRVSQAPQKVKLARAIVVCVFVALTVASIGTTVGRSAIHWHAERIRFEDMNDLQRRISSSVLSLPTVDPFIFTAARRALRPGDRYAFQMGTDRPVGEWIQMYARYFLLPNVMVARPKQADVVFSFLADPDRLRLRYVSRTRPRPQLIVTRLAHGR